MLVASVSSGGMSQTDVEDKMEDMERLVGNSKLVVVSSSGGISQIEVLDKSVELAMLLKVTDTVVTSMMSSDVATESVVMMLVLAEDSRTEVKDDDVVGSEASSVLSSSTLLVAVVSVVGADSVVGRVVLRGLFVSDKYATVVMLTTISVGSIESNVGTGAVRLVDDIERRLKVEERVLESGNAVVLSPSLVPESVSTEVSDTNSDELIVGTMSSFVVGVMTLSTSMDEV
jgi:hypothetical protein